ncbi:MAG: hypothetical protein Q4F71_09325 [Paracoccus sp. (in: a-proteobacteria)]|nr:hypothetical protein [Paracoccus sp. (in: a-proteobacteria)]
MRAIIALCALLAAPAGAATQPSNFTAPEGCVLDMTVQLRSCTVVQQMRCGGGATPDRRAIYFDRSGPFHDSLIDHETRWLEMTDLRENYASRLDPEARSHASFTRLVETGRDDFDFWMIDAGGYRINHRGTDVLTGRSIEVDGVTLEITRFRDEARDGSGLLLYTREGHQFIKRDARIFFGGTETYTLGGADEAAKLDDTPVQIRREGQPGFGATRPQFGCDPMISSGPRQGRPA